MADDILNVHIGAAGDLVAADLAIDNTNRTVGANVSLLSGGVQVPVTVTTATLGANGTVNVAGTTAAGATVGIAFTEGATTATVSTNIAGLTTAVTETVIVACYLRGTHIRVCRDGVDADVAVEALRVGDLAVTASGARRPIRWLGTRSYAGRFAGANPELLPICFKAGALAAGVPVRDLWVSPAHAMVLDGVLIPARALVNGVTVVKADALDSIEYWHVELESHDVLLAEGAPSESYIDDNNRGMFHNADSFRAMYPAAAVAEPAYCAPRLEGGHRVAAVRRQIDGRAGLDTTADALFGDLRGHVDGCDGFTVRGWAQDTLYPDAPVCLDVMVGGKVVALVYADQHRADLERAGIGEGRHGFEVDLPAAVLAGGIVEIRRAADGRALQGSPCMAPVTARAA